jgi:cyclic-di-GMP phosphodiesterase TipF (flagellum assembly factor)
MSKTLQFFYFICYGLAAMAIGFIAPKAIPGTSPAVAWLTAAIVFLAGALMHEIASRSYHAALDRRRLALLHRAYVEATDEIERLAVDLRRLKQDEAYFAEAEAEAVPAPPKVAPPAPLPPAPAPQRTQRESRPPIPDNPATVVERPLDPPAREPAPRTAGPAQADPNRLASEVKVLHALVQRLYAAGAADRGGGDTRLGGKTAVVAGTLLEREILNGVREALRHGNLEVHLHPVATLPQRKHRHFSCAPRILSERGDLLSPGQYDAVLRNNKLTQVVDDMLLFRTVQIAGKARSADAGGYYFCRVPPGCLSDRAFFDDFLAYLRDADDMVSCIAFEFREADLLNLDDATADMLGSLVDLGFHLCIDGLRNFDVDAAQLAGGGVRFVKMDAATLAPAITVESEGLKLRRLKAGLDAAGIDLIVANIANEQLLVELLDFDIGFGQGPLFGDARKLREARAPAAEGRRERM